MRGRFNRNVGDHSTNLKVLKPSRAKPSRGDIFAASLPSGEYLFGRVIDTQARVGAIEGVLIYIYSHLSNAKSPPALGELNPASLLVPPIITNRLPWARGFFQKVADSPLRPEDRLSQHCFRRSNGQYFDEANNELLHLVEPCGDWGLHSYRTIDDAISEALGIPLAAD